MHPYYKSIYFFFLNNIDAKHLNDKKKYWLILFCANGIISHC